MASEKMSDFLILNHTIMRIFPRHEHKNEGIDDFLFSFPDKRLIPAFFLSKRIRFSFSLVTIPCDWDYSLAYGFHYSKDPSPAVRKFLRFVRQVAETEALHL